MNDRSDSYEDELSDGAFREAFGISRRQAQNLDHLFERRRKNRGYEGLGRGVHKKILLLVGTAGGSIWLLMSDKFKAVVAVLLK